MERFQDALLREELDPGLFRRSGQIAVKKEPRIEQFLEVLWGIELGDGHSFEILRVIARRKVRHHAPERWGHP